MLAFSDTIECGNNNAAVCDVMPFNDVASPDTSNATSMASKGYRKDVIHPVDGVLERVI